MSIKISSQIWALRGFTPAERLIMIKFSDIADDDGICWPSVTRIAAECEVSERTVQAAIIWAEKCNLLSRTMREGRSTVYKITPADFSPPQELHPANPSPPPPQLTTCTPAIDDIVVYRTVNREPSFEPSKNPPTPKPEKPKLEIPPWIPLATFADFLDHRKKLKKPMTEAGQKLLFSSLAKLREAGNDPQAVLEQSIMRGWQGVFAVKQDDRNFPQQPRRRSYSDDLAEAANMAIASLERVSNEEY